MTITKISEQEIEVKEEVRTRYSKAELAEAKRVALQRIDDLQGQVERLNAMLENFK